MSRCTAKVTGKHRSPWRKAKCPECGKKPAVSVSDLMPSTTRSAESPSEIAGVNPRLAKEVEGLHYSRLFEIAADPDLDPLMLAAVAAETTDDQLRSNIIQHQNANADVLRAVYASAIHPDRRWDEYAEMDVAKHPEAPDDVLIDIAGNGGPRRSIYALLGRDSVPQEAISLLLERSHNRTDGVTLAELIAKHPSTDRDTLEYLLYHDSLNVRAAAAGNVNLPLSSVVPALRVESHTRAAVASRSDLSESQIREFAQDEFDDVAAAALSNPKAPQDLLMSNITPNGEIQPRDGASMHLPIAGNRGASAEVLREVAKVNRFHSLSRALAENPRCPGDVLEGIAGDDASLSIIEAVTKNPNTPLRILPDLVRKHPGGATEEARVRIDEKMDRLGVHWGNEGAREMLFDQEWWNMTAKSDEVFIALQMFNNPEH